MQSVFIQEWTATIVKLQHNKLRVAFWDEMGAFEDKSRTGDSDSLSLPSGALR